jgi:hypothetical protein
LNHAGITGERNPAKNQKNSGKNRKNQSKNVQIQQFFYSYAPYNLTRFDCSIVPGDA